MRHPLVPALLVVLLLGAYAVAGAALAAGEPADSATVSGRVTVENGTGVADAYVILEPVGGDLIAEATDGDQAVAESLLKLGGTDPDGIHVARTDDAGRFETAVPDGEYHVVAVDGAAVSRTRTVAAGNGTVDLVVDEDQVLAVETAATPTVSPGSTVTAEFRVANVDDEPVEGLTVALGDLPAGWTLEAVETSGRYDAANRTIAVAVLPADESVVVSMTLSVPENAESGRYGIPVTADSDTHYVEHDAVTARVRLADATPTRTVVGGEGSDTPPVTETPPLSPATGPESPNGPTVPGFGPLVAVAVLLLEALRRGRSRSSG